jgi:signal transduction histidine kinase/CheY-like chemotaxis protein
MSDRPPPSILYVDDDEVMRHAFTWILKREGFRTREATTGTEALRLAAEKPDLIILDVNLPDIDGFEVCRRIKAHPATAAIPVLHMSGVYVRSEDRTHGLEGGADGYLTKPVEPNEVVATVRSLLRVRQAEEAARTAAREWQATFDAIRDALCLLDPQGRVRRCNRALADLLGKPLPDITSRPLAELLREAFGKSVEPLPGLLPAPEEKTEEGGRKTEERAGSSSFPSSIPPLPSSPGGHQVTELALGERWFHVTSDPVLDEQGALAGWVFLLADITRGKILEEQLRQAQKMEAVGRLAGGIAHDFNNLLTAITSNLSMILRKMPREDPRYEFLLTTEKAAWHAAELTRQLLGFSRRTRLWLAPVDLNHCVQETLAILRRTIDPRIEIEVKTQPDLWTVQADPSQMNQVLMNLCLNARDAMHEGGRLALETGNAVLDADYARLHVDRRPGEFVHLEVCDTGQGIPTDTLPRIFDPFFTTKEQGRGTGLGLALVFGIIKQHDGWIECESTPGQGTCFDIYLPRSQGERPA